MRLPTRPGRTHLARAPALLALGALASGACRNTPEDELAFYRGEQAFDRGVSLVRRREPALALEAFGEAACGYEEALDLHTARPRPSDDFHRTAHFNLALARIYRGQVQVAASELAGARADFRAAKYAATAPLSASPNHPPGLPHRAPRPGMEGLVESASFWLVYSELYEPAALERLSPPSVERMLRARLGDSFTRLGPPGPELSGPRRTPHEVIASLYESARATAAALGIRRLPAATSTARTDAPAVGEPDGEPQGAALRDCLAVAISTHAARLHLAPTTGSAPGFASWSATLEGLGFPTDLTHLTWPLIESLVAEGDRRDWAP